MLVIRYLIAVVLALVAAAPGRGQGFDPTDPEAPFGGIYQFPEAVVPYGMPGPGRDGRNGNVSMAATGFDSASETAAAARGFLNALNEATDKINSDPSLNDNVMIDPGINHQPLIHVKVRIVEVQRSDSLAVSSVLDFITSSSPGAPFNEAPFNANSLNDELRRASGITRLGVPGLVDTTGAGSGMLVNLTSAHINYVASFLATELNADTISAPQVTTLNGKNVQFRAGSKIPFALGQTTISGSTSAVTEVFYKHVGTFVSVTPQIVNWGHNHEGLGLVPPKYATIAPPRLYGDEDIYKPLDAAYLLVTHDELGPLLPADLKQKFDNYISNSATANLADVRRDVRLGLNYILALQPALSRSQLDTVMDGTVGSPSSIPADNCEHCTWKPSDCTINLNLLVRLSDPGASDTEVATQTDVVSVRLTNETNVRAIANEVQVRSGHGAVIGGLITMRDVERTAKVPVLGDLPIVGAALRSKQTDRVKTETLIFVEAEVLPSFECADECGQPLVKAQTARDFCNGQIHLQGEICDGALSYGMHRAGLLGDYLPRPSHGELQYWQQYHQTIRHLRHHKITTHVLDTFE